MAAGAPTAGVTWQVKGSRVTCCFPACKGPRISAGGPEGGLQGMS